jgi:hypothetical protein
MAAQVELSGYSIILVGSFNPAIFQPEWFARNDLISEDDAHAGQEALEVVHPELTRFSTEWLDFETTRDRCRFATSQSARHADLRDLAIGTFTLLSHTPVQAMGLNRDAHFKFASEAEWHEVGDRMAPKEPWQGVLTEPGLRKILMEESREEGVPGYVRVELAPSVKVEPGVFIQVNDHYRLAEAPGVDAAEAVTVLRDRWDALRSRTDAITERILRPR